MLMMAQLPYIFFQAFFSSSIMHINVNAIQPARINDFFVFPNYYQLLLPCNYRLSCTKQ